MCVCLFTGLCLPLEPQPVGQLQVCAFKSSSLVFPLQTALSLSTAGSGNIRPMMLSPSNGAEPEGPSISCSWCCPINYPAPTNLNCYSLHTCRGFVRLSFTSTCGTQPPSDQCSCCAFVRLLCGGPKCVQNGCRLLRRQRWHSWCFISCWRKIEGPVLSQSY